MDLIGETTCSRPKGWLSSSPRCTLNTSDIVKKLGLLYRTDYMNDEQHYLIDTVHGPLVSVPYTNEVFDISFFMRRNYTASQCFEVLKDEFDEVYRDSEKSARILSVGLHPHIIGRAFRARGLTPWADRGSCRRRRCRR